METFKSFAEPVSPRNVEFLVRILKNSLADLETGLKQLSTCRDRNKRIKELDRLLLLAVKGDRYAQEVRDWLVGERSRMDQGLHSYGSPGEERVALGQEVTMVLFDEGIETLEQLQTSVQRCRELLVGLAVKYRIPIPT